MSSGVPVILGYRRCWRSLWLRRIPIKGTIFYDVDDDGVVVSAFVKQVSL